MNCAECSEPNGTSSGLKRPFADDKIASKYLELRLLQYSLIEESYRCYLRRAGVDCSKMIAEQRYVMMIAASMALAMAEVKKVAKSNEAGIEGFGTQLAGFLQTAIPYDEYTTIHKQLVDGVADDRATNLRMLMMEKLQYSYFEAYVKVLSISAASFLCCDVNDEEKEKVIEEAVFDFLIQSENYFGV